MSADPHPFRFPLLTRVPLPGHGEGVIVERSQRAGQAARYRVRFLNAKGRAQEVRVSGPALTGDASPRPAGLARAPRGAARPAGKAKKR